MSPKKFWYLKFSSEHFFVYFAVRAVDKESAIDKAKDFPTHEEAEEEEYSIAVKSDHIDDPDRSEYVYHLYEAELATKSEVPDRRRDWMAENHRDVFIVKSGGNW